MVPKARYSGSAQTLNKGGPTTRDETGLQFREVRSGSFSSLVCSPTPISGQRNLTRSNSNLMSRSGITSGWRKRLSGSCATQTVLGQPSKGPSNEFEPAGDRMSNLVGMVLLHEVETSDNHAVLIGEAAC